MEWIAVALAFQGFVALLRVLLEARGREDRLDVLRAQAGHAYETNDILRAIADELGTQNDLIRSDVAEDLSGEEWKRGGGAETV